MDIDVDALINKLRADDSSSLLAEDELVFLFKKAQEVLFQEGSLLELKSPMNICGDIHGQFGDLLELFAKGGEPPEKRYLFLGDYVDRGYRSLETFALLLAYKIKYPDRLFMLRGNHECRQVNNSYGFYDEVISRFGFPYIWRLANEVFDYLPISATIDNKIFCVHGGISPKIPLIEQTAIYDRTNEPANSSPISDLLWSDPEDTPNWKESNRGAGYTFGAEQTKVFIQNNNIKFIARGHQLQNEGYLWHFDDLLVTVWSAPNYMYRTNNKASIMVLDENLNCDFIKFEAVPNPWKPDWIQDTIPRYFA